MAEREPSLSPRETELLENINIGITAKQDLVKIMGISAGTLDRYRSRIEKKDPDLQYTIYNGKVESALEMRKQGFRWQDIATEVGYKGASSATSAVRHHLNGALYLLDMHHVHGRKI